MSDKPHGEEHDALSWGTYCDSKLERIAHIIPMNDDKLHTLDGYKCWCKPEDGTDCVLHNAADGRLRYQFGWRKFN